MSNAILETRRQEFVYRLRRRGSTFDEIASILACSRQRAHQLFKVAEYKHNRKLAPKGIMYRLPLSEAKINVLLHDNIDTTKKVKENLNDLWIYRGFGPGTLKVLKRALRGV